MMSSKKAPKLVRKIYVTGEINEEAYKAFTKRLSALERQDPTLPIEIELNSGGGTTYDALAMASRMRLSPCELNVTAMGYVASAAVIILAYGDYRKISSECWVMVHEDQDTHEGKTSEVEIESAHMRRMELQWCELLAEVTGTLAAQWAALHKKTTYLNAQECIRLGLVEAVV